jgi:RNA polymerase sigma-70 factor (ECF subfamily)
MSTPSERADLDALLPAIGAGDVDAFGRFVAGAEPPLRASLRSFAAVVDTEAVLQETLLRVWQVAPRFTPDGAPNALLRFAFRACRHLAISEVRRRRGALSAGGDVERIADEADPRPAAPPDPLLRRAIEACRDELPKKPAAALAARLTSQGDEPDAQLALRLGMTLNTFLQNFTRARKLLAACLEKRGVELGGIA